MRVGYKVRPLNEALRKALPPMVWRNGQCTKCISSVNRIIAVFAYYIFYTDRNVSNVILLLTFFMKTTFHKIFYRNDTNAELVR